MIYKVSVKDVDFDNILNEYKSYVKIKRISPKCNDYLLLEKVDNFGKNNGEFLLVRVLFIEHIFDESKIDNSEYVSFEIVFNPIEDELEKKNAIDKKLKKR